MDDTLTISPQFIIVGRLQRDYIITPTGKTFEDVPGGNLLYAATGLGIWNNSIGLISRVGQDYPQEWLQEIKHRHFDVRGIQIAAVNIDLRFFAAYADLENCSFDNPISHYAQMGLPFPKDLLGYTPNVARLEGKQKSNSLTILLDGLPKDYFEARALLLCPMDHVSHTILPVHLRQGNITTVVLDPASNYMQPAFWNEIPAIVKDLTAFLVSEEKLRNLFQGRSGDLWEMAETIGNYGCEIVVIKRGKLGQMVYDKAGNNRWIVPPYPARVSSPLGAGDAFCGGFMAGFQATYSALEAALYGNISASIVIEGDGAFYGLDVLPGLARRRLDALREMVQKA